MIVKIIAFVVIFASVVLLHELGHFIVAKMNDIEVREFMIGFGPKLFKVQGKETEYSIRAIPLGGAVVMTGEEEFDDSPRSFSNKAIWRRLLVLGAGPFMNFVLAIILFFITFTVNGMPTNEITKLEPNMPAIEAGIEEGDVVKFIDDKAITGWKEIISTIGNSDGSELKFTIDRNGEELIIPIVPAFDKQNSRYMVGMSSNVKDAGNSFRVSWNQTWDLAYRTMVFIPKMLVEPKLLNQVSGPVGIAKIIGDSTEDGIWALIYLTALISISLGVFNLLPVVPLDGGKAFLLIIELIIRRPLNEKLETVISYAGLIFVFGLMIIATYKDIIKLF